MTDYTTYKIATLVGSAILPSLVYGINSALVIMILRLLWKGRTADTRNRTLLMTTYIALICAVCTAHWVLSCAGEALSLDKFTLQSNTTTLKLGDKIWPVTTVAFDSVYLTLTCMTDLLLVRVDV